MNSTHENLFPAFERFVEQQRLLANAKGILAARLPRILGQGKTRAEGLDLPPATVERQQDLVALSLPKEVVPGPDVVREIEEAKNAVEAHAQRMRHPENRRRFAMQALSRLVGVRTGSKDNQFFAGRLVLVPNKSGQNWAWSMTPHYPVVDKIPADIDYVVTAYQSADQAIEKWTFPVEQFLDRLGLAWAMARHFTGSDDVLIDDVARVFKIAVQAQRFWGKTFAPEFRRHSRSGVHREPDQLAATQKRERGGRHVRARASHPQPSSWIQIAAVFRAGQRRGYGDQTYDLHTAQGQLTGR